MGDVSSKEQRIRCSIETGGTNDYQDSGRQPPLSLITPIWLQFMLAPTTKTTSCDTAPLPPPALPPPPGGSSPSPPPPPPPGSSKVASPPPPLPTPEEDRIAAAAAEVVSSVPNPGPYEHTTNDVRRMLNLDTHDGFRCEIQKVFNPFFMIGHSFWLGTSMIPDGRNNSYAGIIQANLDSIVLFARVDPMRPSVDMRLINQVFPARLQVNVSGEGNDQAIAEVDFGQETWTANLKYGSMGNGLMWGCNFYQSITPRLAIGGEGMFLAVNNSFLSNYTVKYSIPARTGEEDLSYLPAIPGGLPTTTTTSSELKGSSTIWASLNLAQSLLTLSYLRIVTPQRVTLAAELQCNPMTLDSQVSLGAEFKFLRQKFNTTIDGSGRIQSVVETKLDKAPGSPTLNFSAEMDHAKELTRFGYGMAFEG